MATSSFFYGGFSSPEQKTINALVEALNQKLAEADAERVAAEFAKERAVERAAQAAGSAAAALVSEQRAAEAQAAANAANVASNATLAVANSVNEAAASAVATANDVKATAIQKASEAAASASEASGHKNASAQSAANAAASAAAAAQTLASLPTSFVTTVNNRTGAVTLAKGDVGLSNVDNTSDANKPISTATQAALNAKVGTSGDQSIGGIKTFTSPIRVVSTFDVNGSLGAQQQDGLYVADLGSTQGSTLNPTFTAAILGQSSSARSVGFSCDDKYIYGYRSHSTVGPAGKYVWISRVKNADLADWVTNGVYTTGDQTIGGNKTFTGTTSGITKAMVGLGNVDNTSDANKPISTATQTALNAKAPLNSPAFTGTPTGPTPDAADSSGRIATTAFVGYAAPPGAVALFATAGPPTGWLKANGAAVSRTAYAALFAAIGTFYGAGDGSTTFNLPNARGEFLRCLDDGRGVDPGRTLGSAQLDAMQGHWHTGVYNGSGGTGAANALSSTVQNVNGGGASVLVGTGVMGPISDGTNGTPRIASETRPRNVAFLACIKY